MKKYISILIPLTLAFVLPSTAGVMNASAFNKTPTDIENLTYIIGTHEFTPGELVDAKRLMLAARTISGSSIDDMIIYYKNSSGNWVNSADNNAVITPPTNFTIDYVDTISIIKILGDTAKEELQTKADTYTEDKYSTAKRDEIQNILNEAKATIDTAESEEAINTAKTNAIDAMNAVTPSAVQDATSGKAYDDLKDALTTATAGSTVKLVNNIEYNNGKIIIDKDLTLDLAGKNITDNSVPPAGKTKVTFIVNPGKTLTINNSDTEHIGTLDTTGNGSTNIANLGGTITINGGTFNATKGWSIFMGQSSTTTINGGTFNGWIASNGNQTEKNTLNITGGTFSKLIYLPGAKSETNISGGTFNITPDDDNNAVIEIKAGTLNISGGNFTYNADSSNNANVGSTNNNGSSDFKGVIVATKSTGANITSAYASPIEVNLTGGTFTNNVADSDAIVIADHSKPENTFGITVNIEDGVNIIGKVSKYDKDGKTSVLNDNR